MTALKPGMRGGAVKTARWLRWGELAMLALLAVQTARLLYAAATPPGPVGRWALAIPAAAATGLPVGLDPFAGGRAASGPVMVATLDLVLAGVRLDRATGRGAAILGKPGQPQLVVRVGEAVAPGVRLAAVAFDHVTLDQGGRLSELYMDQSAPAAAVAPVAPAAVLPPPALAAAARNLGQEIEATPRLEGGVVTGYALGPNGGGDRFRSLGLQPGDVLVAVDGRPVQQLGPADVAGIGSEGAELQIERDGRRVTLRARP